MFTTPSRALAGSGDCGVGGDGEMAHTRRPCVLGSPNCHCNKHELATVLIVLRDSQGRQDRNLHIFPEHNLSWHPGRGSESVADLFADLSGTVSKTGSRAWQKNHRGRAE
jgi:hypothetical protein